MQPIWKQIENNSSTTIQVVRIILLLLIIAGIALLITQKVWVPRLVDYLLKDESILNSDQILPTNSLVQLQKISSSTVSCIEICEPFDFQKYFDREIPFDSDQNYSDPSGKHIVVLKPIPEGARNISVEIYVDGKLAGETGGRGILQPSFSPDGRYFAFLVQATISCCEIWRGINVVDLNSAGVMELTGSTVELKSNKEDEKLFAKRILFMESYRWGENNTIFVTGYMVGTLNIDQYYRISLKQVWSYPQFSSQSLIK